VVPHIGAVWNRPRYPISPVCLHPAVPIRTKGEQVSVERVQSRAVSYNEADVNQAMRNGALLTGARFRLNKCDAVPCGISQFEFRTAVVLVLDRCGDAHVAGRQVAAQAFGIGGAESDYLQAVGLLAGAQ